MRRRRLLLGLGAVVLLGLASFCVIAFAVPRSGVTLENYERIQVGMTLPEVEGILGTPVDGYFMDEDENVLYLADVVDDESGELSKLNILWVGDDVVVRVTLDSRKQVHSKSIEKKAHPSTLFARLRRLLPW
jgi:hypothetical protein